MGSSFFFLLSSFFLLLSSFFLFFPSFFSIFLPRLVSETNQNVHAGRQNSILFVESKSDWCQKRNRALAVAYCRRRTEEEEEQEARSRKQEARSKKQEAR